MSGWVRAFSPASVGNVAVGFDILGHGIEGVGDTVAVRRIDAPEVRISAITGATVDLPREAVGNTAGAALIALRQALELPYGFEWHEYAQILGDFVTHIAPGLGWGAPTAGPSSRMAEASP